MSKPELKKNLTVLLALLLIYFGCSKLWQVGVADLVMGILLLIGYGIEAYKS